MSDVSYIEYPVTMVHPHFKPSEAIPIPGTQRFGPGGQIIYQDYRGTQERLPPVVAVDRDAEERLMADGYVRGGKIDPSAWVKEHSTAPPETYAPVKYPMWRDGVLYMTAQEDPEAAEEDLAEFMAQPAPDGPGKPTPPYVDPMAANHLAAAHALAEAQKQQIGAQTDVIKEMRAQMEAMQAQMAQFMANPPAKPATKRVGRPPKAKPAE